MLAAAALCGLFSNSTREYDKKREKSTLNPSAVKRLRMFIKVTACLSDTALCWSCGVINRFVFEVISVNKDIIKHLPYSHIIQAHI